jgi:hypothetical protein
MHYLVNKTGQLFIGQICKFLRAFMHIVDDLWIHPDRKVP